MAKKTSGASEINGFIAVPNEKPKTTSRPGAVKKTSNSNSTTPTSKSTSSTKDAKAAKTGASSSVKKVADKEVKKTEAKTTVKPSRTVPKTEPPKNGKAATSSVKTTPTVKTSSTPVKKSVVAKTSLTGGATPKVAASKVQPTASKLAPGAAKPRLTSKTDSSKAESSPSNRTKVVAKTSKDSPASKPVNSKTPSKPAIKSRSIAVKQPGDVQKAKASVAQKPTGNSKSSPKVGSVSKPGPKNKHPIKPSAPQPIDRTNSSITGVAGKSGLTFDITLEPAKAPKPSALPSEILSEGAVASAVDGSKPQAPPPLVKQRTFVKDEEDEELKSSLPHIVAPEELKAPRKDDDEQYEDDDFEEYESDFEVDASDTEPSISEASGAVSKTRWNSASRQKSAAVITKPVNAEPATKPHPSKPEGTTFTASSKGNASISTLTKAANPDVSRKSSSETEHADPDDGANYDYEDDFEDYSSDFEEDSESGFTSSNETTSESSSTTASSESEDVDANKTGLKGKVVEEERKLDSGNYDLKTSIARSDVIRQSQLNYIKEAISRENTMFKDGMPVEKSPSPPPLKIMDFKGALERKDEILRKKLKLGWTRGKTILSMIKLHEMDFHIFEMKPMNYEEFIKLRGHSNHVQQEVQTKEDDIWEETQTEDIETEDKWTQCPISYHSWAGKPVDWNTYLQDKRGFGTSNPPILDRKQFSASNYNAKRLQTFVTVASQVMTVLLEEEAYGFKSALSLQQTESNFGFSEGYVAIYCEDIDFLKDRKVTHVCFSPHFSNIVATCYDRATQPEEYLPVELTSRWLICLWDMIAVSQPTKILVASAPVESITFDCLYPDLFYAGLSDGTICLWDLSEPDSDHDYCRRANFDSILRTPTYCTFSSGVDTAEVHASAVAWLRSISSGGGRVKEDDVITPTTLFSMSEDGKLITWTVVRLPENVMHRQKVDVRLSPWGRVRLALTSVHQPTDSCPKDLQSHVDFLCMEVKQKSVLSVLLGTNLGFVCQYPLVKFKTVISRFGDKNNALLITAIELCPFDPRCFLVGVSDGSLRLHTEMASQPLKTITISNSMATAIACIRWSCFKAGLVITLDQNANLLVWNLSKSDQQPVVKMSLKAPAKEKTAALKESLATRGSVPPEQMDRLLELLTTTRGLRDMTRVHGMDISRDIRLPYLGVVVSESTVHVHRFSDEFATKGAHFKNDEINILRTYFDLLHK